eukprot:9547543-Prorocentrum_lima.AAC.1
MTSSLVGSEMCIRDRQNGKIGKQTAEALWDLALDGNRVTECEARTIAVSYTHLTLPTICSV